MEGLSQPGKYIAQEIVARSSLTLDPVICRQIKLQERGVSNKVMDGLFIGDAVCAMVRITILMLVISG